ncbi:hypothetical protein, partial [Acinetobacter baumannii]|uniref:hypothetical protein n=1 Tax=Acinetobacter baumannii TaxID=470 RepID=UPI00148A97C2
DPALAADPALAVDPALAADYDSAGDSLTSKGILIDFKKRDVSAAAAAMVDAPAAQTGPVSLALPISGRVRFF